MSRRASPPSASKPSGMSDRPVFARVFTSATFTSCTPARLFSVMVAAFSEAMMPAKSWPFFVSRFHA